MLEAFAAIAVLVLGFLTYLLFFERGPTYSTLSREELEADGPFLPWWRTLLSLPHASLEQSRMISSGQGFYDHHVDLISAASSTIHLEVYILKPGKVCQRILTALAEKSRQGVEVRVLLDRVGSFSIRSSHLKELRQAGASVEIYHALGVHSFRRFNNRSHRNLLIVDGTDAMIGGAGIADVWDRSADVWRDSATIVRGDVVRRLQAIFCLHWREVTGEILADEKFFPDAQLGESETPCLVLGSSPITGGSSPARLLFQLALGSANHSIDLCSPYFIPDRGIREVLIAASRKGVHVRVITSGPYSDHGLARRAGRRRYGPLLKNGIELYEYSQHMMHTKALIIDGRCVIIGSTNMDNRSFNLNDEVNLVIEDAQSVQPYADMFVAYLGESERVTLEDWLHRSWRERALAHLGRWLERHG